MQLEFGNAGELISSRRGCFEEEEFAAGRGKRYCGSAGHGTKQKWGRNGAQRGTSAAMEVQARR